MCHMVTRVCCSKINSNCSFFNSPVPNAADETEAVISVVQYFHDKYNVHLRYPLLSAIQACTDAKRTVITSETIQVSPMKQVSVYSIERNHCITSLLKNIIDKFRENGVER